MSTALLSTIDQQIAAHAFLRTIVRSNVQGAVDAAIRFVEETPALNSIAAQILVC